MKQNELDALFAAAKNGDEKTMKELGSKAVSGLSGEHKKTIEKAMNDPVFLNDLLSSEKAKQILNKLQGDNK